MERYDIAIIGTGPAGISAAITAKIRNKNILLAGSRELTKKLESAREINNYPGFPAVKGEKLAEAFSGHLKGLDIKITETKVTNIYAMGDYFALQSIHRVVQAAAGLYHLVAGHFRHGITQRFLFAGNTHGRNNDFAQEFRIRFQDDGNIGRCRNFLCPEAQIGNYDGSGRGNI